MSLVKPEGSAGFIHVEDGSAAAIGPALRALDDAMATMRAQVAAFATHSAMMELRVADAERSARIAYERGHRDGVQAGAEAAAGRA